MPHLHQTIPHTPNCHAKLILNCHAELVSASLLQPAENLPRHHSQQKPHNFHPHPTHARPPLPSRESSMPKDTTPHTQQKPPLGAFFCSHPHPTPTRPPLPSRERRKKRRRAGEREGRKESCGRRRHLREKGRKKEAARGGRKREKRAVAGAGV